MVANNDALEPEWSFWAPNSPAERTNLWRREAERFLLGALNDLTSTKKRTIGYDEKLTNNLVSALASWRIF